MRKHPAPHPPPTLVRSGVSLHRRDLERWLFGLVPVSERRGQWITALGDPFDNGKRIDRVTRVEAAIRREPTLDAMLGPEPTADRRARVAVVREIVERELRAFLLDGLERAAGYVDRGGEIAEVCGRVDQRVWFAFRDLHPGIGNAVYVCEGTADTPGCFAVKRSSRACRRCDQCCKTPIKLHTGRQIVGDPSWASSWDPVSRELAYWCTCAECGVLFRWVNSSSGGRPPAHCALHGGGAARTARSRSAA